MNNKVTVTGMQVQTKVSNNLLIDDFANGSWATNDSTFSATLNKPITSGNVIVPLSTVNGINFYYVDPTNVKGDGDANSNTYIAYSNLTTLQEKYPNAEAPYLDYHFVLKAENTSNAAQNIIVSKLDLKYSGANDGNKAFRIAVLLKEFATATVDGAKTEPGLPAAATKIYAPTGAVNYTTGEAVNNVNSTGSVTYASSINDSIVTTVDGETTKYYEVTVRLWLEGEDKTCTINTFKGLDTGNWTLAIDFSLTEGTTGGVYVINMGTTPAQP